MHIISSLSSPIPDIVLRSGICWHCQGHPRTGKKIQIKNPVVQNPVQMGSNCDGVNDKKTKEEILHGLSSKTRDCCDYNHRKRGAPVNPKLHSCLNSLQRKPQMLHILANPNRLFLQCYENSAKGRTVDTHEGDTYCKPLEEEPRRQCFRTLQSPVADELRQLCNDPEQH
jgi:hypothetical protein